MWRAIYSKLSAKPPGLLGAATARAEAQVVRLSLIYALLDRAAAIGTEHLTAALALWRYCADSAHRQALLATGASGYSVSNIPDICSYSSIVRADRRNSIRCG